jgi:predicted regulator of Ras-like GTPase activity (Roadblock/LC7/MglB family)
VAQAREFLERRAASRAPDADTNGGGGGGASAPSTPAPAAQERPGRRSDPFPHRRPHRSGNPVRLFDPLEGDSPFLGAVILDDKGLALAGAIPLGGGRGELLGALLSTAVSEARRTTRLLGMGAWTGVLVDCDDATLHVSPLDDGAMLVLAAGRDAPSGWVVRTAEQARRIACEYLGSPA